MENYKHKANKYKIKYMNALKQRGGANDNDTDIRILVDDKWRKGFFHQKKAYMDFIKKEEPLNYNKSERKFKIMNDTPVSIPIMIRENGTKSFLIDWNNIKVGFNDNNRRTPFVWNKADDCIRIAYVDYVLKYNKIKENIQKTYNKSDILNLCESMFDEPDRTAFKNNIMKEMGDEVIFTFYLRGQSGIYLVINDDDDNGLYYIRHSILNQTKILDMENDSARKNLKKYLEEAGEPNTTLDATSSNVYTWFGRLFGFDAQPYPEAKKELIEKVKYTSSGLTLNDIKIGEFNLISGYCLDENFIQLPNKGEVTLKNTVSDIKDIKTIHKTSPNATIQVATRFDCLLNTDGSDDASRDITRYRLFKTQDFITIMAAPAGLAYRNYLYKQRHANDSQINMISNLLKYFQSKDSTIEWKMKNGYLFITDDCLNKINVLLDDKDTVKTAKKLIQVGSHINQAVYIDETPCDHTINHVYCGGIENINDKNSHLWDKFSQLILEATYENTLKIACLNNFRSGQNNQCYLTQFGNEPFKMKRSIIASSISKACESLANLGYSLNVILVHYEKPINEIYADLEKTY